MTRAPLTLTLFGPMRVLIAGEPMPRVRTRAAEWLLALLVLRQPRTVSRAWLADALWPDSEQSQALQNLRHALLSLRKALGPEEQRIQSPTRDTLFLDLEGVETDLVRFDRALQHGDEAALRTAVAAYTGPLLEGCLEEWVFTERESRRQSCLNALLTLADLAERRHDYADAATLLRRAEEMDSLRSTPVLGLMRVLAAGGDTPAALRTYQDYRRRLRQEMRIEPDADMVRLYQAIRDAAGRERLLSPETPPAAEPLPAEKGDGEQNDALATDEAHPAPKVWTAAPEARSPAFNLPHALTALIGREREASEIARAVSSSRLVTLVGGGGVGKTRLAVHVAREIGAQFTAGAAFVSLAPLADPALLPAFVASALGMREEATPEPEFLLHALMGWLTSHPLLLVLDNCEHLVEATAALAQSLLEHCPHLHILATSRQRLALTGEVVWRVPSLSSPDPDQLSREEDPVKTLLQYPAARLFVERAEMARPGFQLDGTATTSAIARICWHLDGIPLAIELAAARIGLLNVGQIASRLDDRFRLLTGGSRTVLARHQTLRSLIDWSYDLLTPQERTLLCRLSLFVGGWTLEAVEAVEGDLDLLASLMDKSLVLAQEQEAGPRYRMLETVREYAGEKLRASGDEAAARRRHGLYFLALAEEQAPALQSSTPEAVLGVLAAEVDNLRSALTWAQAQTPEIYLRFVAVLWPFWEIHGYLSEGRAHLRAALQRVETPDSPAHTQALLGATVLAVAQFDMAEALVRGQECLERFRARDDLRGMAAALLCLAEAYRDQRDYDGALALTEEGLDFSRRSAWSRGMASALLLQGRVARLRCEWSRARPYFEQALALAEALGDHRLIASACYQLGSVAMDLDDDSCARRSLVRSLEIYKELGDRLGISRTLGSLGVLERKGDLAQAMAYTREYVATSRELGNPADEGHGLHQVGHIHYQQGQYEEARRAYQAALEVFQGIGTGLGLSFANNSLGNALFHLGRPQEAQRLHREALHLYRDRKNQEGIVWALERFTVVEATYGNAERAACLIGTASLGRKGLGIPLAPWDQADWDQALASVQEALGEATSATLLAEGGRRSLEQAVAEVLAGGF